MVNWKFKCLNCGHSFKAIEPIELYEAYDKCAICGSINIEKKIIKEGAK